MTTALTRSITENMEEDLYAPVSEISQTQQQSQPQPQINRSQSQNDYLQYLSLPNMSQDSLPRYQDSENNINSASDHIPSNQHMESNESHQIGQNEQSNAINNNGTNFGENDDAVYNSYGNPNSFANNSLTQNLYNNLEDIDSSSNNFDYKDLINPQFTNASNNNNNNLNNGIDDLLSNSNSNNINYNQFTNNIHDDLKDDVLMIPQDNFYIYDQYDPQFVPEMMELELANKSFQHSNELNLFKANDVLYEFSDDEEDDDEIELQNKLDDDDMEMKFDDEDDDENSSPMSNNSASFDNSSPNELVFADNYLTSNDLELESDNRVSNSIYSLTIPNDLTSNNDIYLNSSQPFHALSPQPNFSTIELYNSEEEDVDREEEDEDEEEEDDRVLDNETPFNGSEDEDALEINDDIYTPLFHERRESVTAERCAIKKERSKSLKSSTKPKRIRRASNKHLSSTPMNLLRRPKVTPETNTSYETGIEDDDDKEEHICTIPNPKTGKPCLKKFSRPYDLVRHQNTIHASKRSFYRCMFCEDDLRRRNNMDSINEIVTACKYRNTKFSTENSESHVSSSHNVKKIKSGVLNNSGYLSNKTFSRCDALTRHLRFRHGLTNNQVNDAMAYAKKHVEYYDN
ncbi:hypothetical protein CANINC_001660 [Pichia inconspicua]|uniref:C2H2-type domain-containing protein n=1 Tax=Pichia inconspicua TaxID=52247 RepID=A0A4T0X4A5_9ASCO|nr:hypothetical protein CANINC_001660 [[Candida] inconspicua]